ncbi:hypothetical protein [Bacillus coahuilensis]|uniref:hypothetical protein n=1 Tax=Bacillus coahuilensis TaxID=408580 RepID=UPI00018511E3|nr:hypothetical protein [Bacillus coahuilensis]
MYRYHPFYPPIQRPVSSRTMRYPYPVQVPHRDFPPVDPNIFMNSAKTTLPIMEDGILLMKKISTDVQFATHIMDAAQQSDNQKVKKLVNSIGMTTEPSLNFNPDGFSIHFMESDGSADCCKVDLSVRWR